MNLVKIQKSWGYWLERRAVQKRVKKDNDHYFELMAKNGVEVRRLNAEQRGQVDEIYGQYRHLRAGRYTYDTHELVYSATGVFEPTVMPETFFRLLDGYRPVFRSWDGELYERELIRAAIDARARHVSKLMVEVKGTAQPQVKSRQAHHRRRSRVVMRWPRRNPAPRLTLQARWCIIRANH